MLAVTVPALGSQVKIALEGCLILVPLRREISERGEGKEENHG
jgi:hypothetical protein